MRSSSFCYLSTVVDNTTTAGPTTTTAERGVGVGGGRRNKRKRDGSSSPSSSSWEGGESKDGWTDADIDTDDSSNADYTTTRTTRGRRDAAAARIRRPIRHPHRHAPVVGVMPSAAASNMLGFRSVTRLARSLLYHELGVPLACYLDGPEAFRTAQRQAPELFQSVPMTNATVPFTTKPHEPSPPRCDDFLKESVEEWIGAARAVGGVPMERGLTSLLSTRMREALQEDGMTVAHDEKLVAAGGGGFGFGGYPDILVRQHEILEGDHHRQTYPVLLVEVGLRNGEWWKKVDQALMYAAAGGLLPGFDADMPILVTALTLEIAEVRKPNTKSKPQKKKRRTSSTTKSTTIGSKQPPSGAFQRGRIGTFLVTTATNASKRSTCADDLRVILLRRVETASVSVLSAEMGKVISAAQLLPAWARLSRQQTTTTGGQHERHQQQESFGPHSRRVGTKVRYAPLSRVDTWLCLTFFTPRSPGVPSLRPSDNPHGSQARWG
jgi:hypothetical protein